MTVALNPEQAGIYPQPSALSANILVLLKLVHQYCDTSNMKYLSTREQPLNSGEKKYIRPEIVEPDKRDRRH